MPAIDVEIVISLGRGQSRREYANLTLIREPTKCFNQRHMLTESHDARGRCLLVTMITQEVQRSYGGHTRLIQSSLSQLCEAKAVNCEGSTSAGRRPQSLPIRMGNAGVVEWLFCAPSRYGLYNTDSSYSCLAPVRLIWKCPLELEYVTYASLVLERHPIHSFLLSPSSFILSLAPFPLYHLSTIVDFFTSCAGR